MTFDDVFTPEHLYISYRKCIKGVGWKGTVQNYKFHSLTNLEQTYQELKSETFKSGHFYRFDIMERGKLRHIKSVGIKERIVQRCLCDYCLVPTLSKLFIYDNMACIKDRGVHKAINRMKFQLQKYYKKYKTNEGYILQFDFHHYFETIPHKTLLEKVSNYIDDPKLMRLISQLVNDFDGDFGMGLGSQISQILALYYPNDIDHVVIRTTEDGYGRYMDDGHIISRDKEVLRKCRKIIEEMTSSLGIILNENKTQISKLSHGFVYLKARYFLTSTGKVVLKPNKKNITKNRRKLRKLIQMGKSKKELDAFVQCVVGNWKHYDAYWTIRNFKKFYKEELKMLKHEHPYIDEQGTEYHDLERIFSDEGYQILQEDTGLIYEDVVDLFPTKHQYKELSPEYYESLERKVDA